MRDQGRLSADADPAILAETTMAMTQGGILLATTKKDIRTLEATLAAVLAYLRSFDAARGPRPVRSAPHRRSSG
jgi:hypothetical protein